MDWAYRRAEHLVKAVIDRDRLLDEGESVAVGVSGGADSLCLLHLLLELNTRSRRDWDLHALHVDPGFPGSRPDRVSRACAALGVGCTVLPIDVPAALRRSRLNPCYVCSRERRKVLFKAASSLGCRRVALGHHLEDVNETFLVNLLFTSSGTTLMPAQSLFRGALAVVRPLYYIDKKLIRTCLRQAGIRPVPNPCPYHRTGTRLLVRRILGRLARLHPRTPTNLFWGIHNLKPEYLPRRAR